MEKAGSVCEFFLGVYDGFDDSAPELLKACGSNLTPIPITSSSNVVYLRLLTDPMKQGTLFLLDWLQVDRNKPKGTENSVNASGCDAVIDLSNRTDRYELTSPGYPYGYKNKLDCQWIFETKPGYQVILDITTMDLEQSSGCTMDYVQIFKGSRNTPDWRYVTTLCLPNATAEETSVGTSLMKVLFHTDSLKNETGFAALLSSVCGGLLTDPNGVIQATNITKGTTRSYRLVTCQWNVTVRAGRQIAVTFERFDLAPPGSDSTFCGGETFIMLKNGGSEDSPLLGKGKYCGSTIPDIPRTTSNRLFIKYQALLGSKGFRLEYKEVSQACGENIMLTKTFKEMEMVNISSPNYPNIPPPHTECTWVIMASAGERLHIDFIDRFDIARSADCKQAAVELRDGGTQSSRLLGGPYCMDMPSSTYTTGNILYVRYFTDVNDPKDGFIANVSIATCGGTIRDSKGYVTSPNHPGNYPANIDCQWRIVGPKSHSLNVQLQVMDFRVRRSNCSVGDYITIDEVLPGNGTGTFTNSLGMFCKSEKLNETIQISGNEALITFHSGASADNTPFTGFKLFFNASKDACGQTMNTPSGVFQSPGYPVSTLNTRLCEWKITVPLGRRITLTFLDIDLDTSSNVYGQRLTFYNDFAYKSRIAVYNSSIGPQTIKSSSNTMHVYLWARHFIAHRGFKASYSSDEPTVCAGDLNSTSGVIVRPPINITTFSCEWENVRSPAINQTLAITVTESVIGTREFNCRWSQTLISVTAQSGKLHLADLCGNITSPMIIRSPFVATKLLVTEGSFHGHVDFQINYRTSPCGGLLTGPVETISSPGFPVIYPKDTDCAWSVEYPSGQAIQVHFVSMDLEPACDKDYVIIYNGPTPTSPIIGKYCGNVLPADIKSQSNTLWIDFHSDGNNANPGFQLTLEPLVSGCGGVFHSQSGELSTPQFPKQYPNNAECEWELRVENGYTIQFVFIDRFGLEMSNNCEKDFVEIYDLISPDEWKKIGRFCGRTAPEMLNSTGSQMKILFRSDPTTQGDGFKAKWSVTCGGMFVGLDKGRIVSPGFPGAYGKNLQCNYTISAPGQQIATKFTTFVLELGYSKICRYDNVTLYGYLNPWSRETQALGTYCHNNKPPDRIFKNKLTLEFKTDQYVEFKGFVMEFEINRCGQPLNAPGKIELLYGGYEFMGAANCTWVITAPADNVIVIRFSSLELEHSYHCHYDSVSVYDGALVNESTLLGQFCGNLSSSLPVIKSKTNQAVVSLTMLHKLLGFKLAADVMFTSSELAGCGGKLNVSASGNTLRSPGTKYKPFLDCHWLLTAPESQTVSLQFTSLSIAPCFNRTFNATTGCACDYIEIRDGGSQFADLIGRFCSEKPVNPIMSSANKMWVRFASDGVNEAPGFTATLKSTLPLCGVTVFNITNTTQAVVTSPKWPENYPTNLRCRWLLSGPRMYRLAIHFQEIQLDDSDDCADRLTFNDIGNLHLIPQGMGEDTIRYAGQPNRPISVFRGSRSPTTAVQFCGSPSQMDFYSESSDVSVTFTTNQQGSAKGFKMTAGLASCTRNYTGPQGRILVEQLPEHCYIVISAQPNHTISLYFTSFQIYSSSVCSDRALEIRDGVNGEASVLSKTCGYELPNPVFSTGSNLYLHSWRPVSNSFEHFDITYTTTDQGPGCGGAIFNYGGTFSSPSYPNNVRKATVCRWDITVPYGTLPALRFMVFDLGSKSTCTTDFVELIDIDSKTGVEFVRTRYCGEDDPALYMSEMSTVAVRYTTSVHNGGTGWLIRFMGRAPGAPISTF